MKKIYVLLFALSLLIGTGHAQSVNQPRKGINKLTNKSSVSKTIKLRTTAVKKLPLKAQIFFWDNVEEIWIENGYKEYTYDTRGNTLKELIINNQGDSSEIFLNSYNSHDQQTERIRKHYTGAGEWVNSTKETTSYDTKGNLTENIFYYWANNQWKISWGYQAQFILDPQDRIIEEIALSYYPDGETWINESKITYGYSGNEQDPNIITEYGRDEDTWVKTGEYTNIVWKYFGGLINEDLEYVSLDYTKYDEGETTTGRMSTTTDGIITVYLDEIYSENAWTGAYRSTKIEQPDGSTIITNEYFEDGSWKYAERSTEYTDSKGEPAGYKHEEYESGEWTTNFSDLITSTYNDNDEKIEIVREYISGDYSSKEKQVFSDFITIDKVTGLSSSAAFASLSLFPNPATDIISFENIPAGSELSIATIGNQTVWNAKLPESSARISVADLQPGIYFATIRSASGEAKTLKFIKR